MRIDCVARYTLLGALAVVPACSSSTKGTETGRITTVDTGATVRVRPEPPPDTARADTADARSKATDSARMTVDSMAGWPKDTSHGGWSSPPDLL